jgi:hypothetical protein
MSEEGLFRKKKRKNEDVEPSEVLPDSELDIDLDSDHPVHEDFVSDKRLREIRKKGIRKI